MATKDTNIPLQGMSNDHPMNLKENQYPLMVNGNIQTDITGPITLTNEHSNILCLQEKFAAGYKLIGELYVPENKVTYVFLVNGLGGSEIGYIKECQYTDPVDAPSQDPCDSCGVVNVEAPPLETQTQQECCTYVCISKSTCLNFSLDHPIRKPVYKKDNCGGTLYFTDFHNPVRALKLTPDNEIDDSVRAVDYYLCDGQPYSSCEQAAQAGCTCCTPVYFPRCFETDLDCDKILLFPKASAICVQPEIVAAGGSLRAGTYQLAACYADANGQRATRTFATCNPVSIFDYTQTITSEVSYPTNYAVKFKLTGLNPELYPYINLFVVATINNVPSVKQYGPIDITSVQNGEFEYLVSNFEKGIDVTIDDILQIFPVYEKAQEITTAGNVLLLGNLSGPRDLNLQPAVVNLSLTPGAITWQTIKAKENFYANGVNAGKYRGYLRDEVYPLGIVFERNNTLDTCVYPLVGRASTSEDTDPAPANKDNFNSDPCAEIAAAQMWQVYNTAHDASAACNATPDVPVCVQKIDTVFCSSFTYRYTVISYSDASGSINNSGTVTSSSGGSATIVSAGTLNGNNYIYVQNVTGTFNIGDTITAGGTAIVTQFSLGSDDPKDCYVNEVDASSDCSGNYPTLYNDPSIDGTGTCDPNPDVTGGYCLDHYVRPQSVANVSTKPLCVDATLALYPNNISDPYAYLVNSFIEEVTPAETLTVVCYDSTASLADDIVDADNPSTLAGGSGPFFFPGLQDSPAVTNRKKSGAIQLITSENGSCMTAGTAAAPTMYFWGADYTAVQTGDFCYGSGSNCDGFSECGVEETTESAAGGDVFGVNTPVGSDYQPYWFTFNALKITQVISIKLFTRLSSTIPAGILEAVVYDSDGTTEIVRGTNDSNGAIVLIAGNACEGEAPLKLGSEYFVKVYLNDIPDTTNFLDLNSVTATTDGWDCSDPKTLATYNYAWASICINAPDSTEKEVNVPAFYRRKCEYAIYYREFEIPEVACDFTNYEKGQFAYWESGTKVYPKTTYIDASGNEKPLWGDLCGQKIRHFKFPDNYVSPFQDYNQLNPSPGRVANIYPLGFNVDTEQVKAWLIWAENEGLITPEERASITGYKLVRGNRVGNKSIAAKGLLYDMWRYNLYNYANDTQEPNPTEYPSYPFNDLGNDYFLTYGAPLNAKGNKTKDPNPFVHPFQGTKNYSFAFLSPDTTFNAPSIGTELKIEGTLYGDSLGNFYEVLNHPKYVILSTGGVVFVNVLTALSWAVDFLNLFAEIYKYFNIGTSVTVGTQISIATASMGFALGSVGTYLRYGKQWQDIILGFGTPQNFAKYFVGVGNYHSMTATPDVGNIRRSILSNMYITGGNYNTSLNGISRKINNYKREDSVYLSLDPNNPIEYSPVNLLNPNISDNSRYRISDVGGNTRDIQRRVASLYASIKYYNPDQYGELSDIEWIYTGTCRKIDWNTTQDQECEPIFGGDTFISRMSQKRKFPFFLNTAVGVASSADFQYRLLGNITTPTYYFNSLGETPANSGGVNFTANETNLDDASYKGLFTKGTMYLFSYGITYFLCEADYNLNYRYATDNRDRAFYPYQADLENWTQEYRIPIDVPNSYQYNRDYSKQNKENFFCSQPGIYSNDLCLTVYKNRVINSQEDNDSDFYSDPWRIFLANDYKDFPLENGQLVGLNGVERNKLVLRFNNTTWVLNAYYTVTTDAGVAQIGAASLFQQKPAEFAKTELGYGGTQHHAFITTQFGHFWVDAARSAVFMLPAGDGGLQEISLSLNSFFNNNLPFFILKGFPNYQVDNNYKHVGISMGWDNKFDRMFLTKLDYDLKSPYKARGDWAEANSYITNDVVLHLGEFYLCILPNNGAEVTDTLYWLPIQITDTNYFCNKSWTMAYSPLTKSWISYYSFLPNYYIGHENYFQTGLNYPQTGQSSELGIWNHLFTNKSYQVFYGKLYPFITDVVVKEQLINKELHSIEYQADFLRFQNDYDYFYNPGVTFNKMVIWSENRNTGNLELVPQIPGNLAQSGLYPITNANSTSVLVTRKQNNWRVNQFWDLVRNKYSNVPPMVYNCHPYLKQVNPVAIQYNKPTFERSRLTSDYFYLRFINDVYSNYKIVNKWFINNTIKSYT